MSDTANRSLALPPLIYLASASPRRQELLKSIGVRFELLVPGADEDAEALEVPPEDHARLTPVAYVAWAARAKLAAARARRVRLALPQAPILCADTVVALGELVLGKPQDDADAARMLGALSGQVHWVHTAMAYLLAPEQPPAELVVTTQVQFMQLSAAQIASYVQSGEPRGKAGSYAIQGLGASLVDRIEGSLTNVIGLPLAQCRQLLAAHPPQ